MGTGSTVYLTEWVSTFGASIMLVTINIQWLINIKVKCIEIFYLMILTSNFIVVVGYMLDGKRHGFGTFQYASGAKYIGEWIDNMKVNYRLNPSFSL